MHSFFSFLFSVKHNHDYDEAHKAFSSNNQLWQLKWWEKRRTLQIKSYSFLMQGILWIVSLINDSCMATGKKDELKRTGVRVLGDWHHFTRSFTRCHACNIYTYFTHGFQRTTSFHPYRNGTLHRFCQFNNHALSCLETFASYALPLFLIFSVLPDTQLSSWSECRFDVETRLSKIKSTRE